MDDTYDTALTLVFTLAMQSDTRGDDRIFSCSWTNNFLRSSGSGTGSTQPREDN
jgi:hypothetical protein